MRCCNYNSILLSRILYLATQIPLAVQCSAMTFDLPPKMYKPAKTKQVLAACWKNHSVWKIFICYLLNISYPTHGKYSSAICLTFHKKGSPVHVAPACKGSGEGSDDFRSYLHNLSQHFCKRMFLELELMVTRQQLYSCARIPLQKRQTGARSSRLLNISYPTQIVFLVLLVNWKHQNWPTPSGLV
jgi:hypothetical protein